MEQVKKLKNGKACFRLSHLENKTFYLLYLVNFQQCLVFAHGDNDYNNLKSTATGILLNDVGGNSVHSQGYS